MSYYIPDPIELMEMRAERMMEKHFDFNKPGMFLCACCNQWLSQADGIMEPSSDPSSPPICHKCSNIIIAGTE